MQSRPEKAYTEGGCEIKRTDRLFTTGVVRHLCKTQGGNGVVCCGVNKKDRAVKNYIGAIDQGTTSTRFMVFDQSARVAAVAQKEHEQIFSKPGWVEHDPLEILTYGRSDCGRARAARLARFGSRGNRHHQSAGDHRPLGAQDRQAVCKCNCLAGHEGCGRCRALRQRGRARPLPAADRIAAEYVLQRPEASLAA